MKARPTTTTLIIIKSASITEGTKQMWQQNQVPAVPALLSSIGITPNNFHSGTVHL
jgi:hypothetical protein